MTHTPEIILADRGSFKIARIFPVNYRIAAKDPCHLNGMRVENDEPCFATCVGRSNVSDGWRDTLGGGRCTTSALRHVAWSKRLYWMGRAFELYDVALLPRVVCPMAHGFSTHETSFTLRPEDAEGVFT